MAFNGNSVINGDALMLFVQDGATKKALAMATSHTLSKTLSTNEVACKDSGVAVVNTPGKVSWEISTENLYSEGSFNFLNSYMTSRTPIMAYFGRHTSNTAYEEAGIGVGEAWDLNTTSASFSYGQVIISNLSINAASGDSATMSATLTGAGPIMTYTYAG